MKAKNKNIMTLEEFKEKNYGKRGTKKRDELEKGYIVTGKQIGRAHV